MSPADNPSPGEQGAGVKTYYDEQETRSRDEREESMNRDIAEMVRLGYERSSTVKKTMDGLGMKPSDIQGTRDLVNLPVISREQLVELQAITPPFGGLDDPGAEIERIFISPGPVYEPHLGSHDPLWARGYQAAGFTKGDVVINTFSYHMVAAGLTFHGGLTRVGATVVPSGASSTQQQVQLIRDLGVTGYTGTPSFLMALIEKASEMGHDFAKDFTLRRASFVAEPLQPSLRKRFEEEFGIDTYQMYGATEVGDIAYECGEKSGWHLCEEVFVEIVDPVTGTPVQPGELGEVVVTRLNSIFFLFRFGTGDLSRIIEEPCPCGRTALRLDGIAGRVGDAVKVRGLFVAPSQVGNLAAQFPGIALQLLIERQAHRDILTARIDLRDTMIDRGEFLPRFERIFQEVCTVKVDKVVFTEPGSIPDDAKVLQDTREWK
ncbi:MAG TPA: phenylacetate--CoA ligase family protein [Deltaproteobacteria bacterium]|nr:phenylacetate--CoA ligase family protein [Deltaproteobacteria bacterium]